MEPVEMLFAGHAHRIVAIFLAIGTLTYASGNEATADGDLDTTFGNLGKVTTSLATFNDAADVALQSDGKIVVVGTLTSDPIAEPPVMVVARYTTAGLLDSDFNGTGYVTAEVPLFGGRGRRVVVQADDRILAGAVSAQITHGSSEMFLVRYESDGTPDATFGTGGMLEFSSLVIDLGDLALTGSGILVSYLESDASFGVHTRVTRLLSGGGTDVSFGIAGVAELPMFSIGASPRLAIRGDGKILVAASHVVQTTPTFLSAFAAGRLSANGAVDTTFGTGGISPPFGAFSYVPGSAAGVALQADDRLVLAGSNNGVFTLVGMGADGGLDAGFGSSATFADPFAARATAVLTMDGKFLAVGGDPQFALARVTASGVLDPTFGDDGRVTTSFGDSFSIATAAAIQADGAIVVVGNTGSTEASSIALARYAGTACAVDTDADGLCDPFDECANGSAFSKARLTVSVLPQSDCSDRLLLKGLLSVPSTSAIDLQATGIRLVVRDGADTVLVDETLPAGAYDAGTRTGWRLRAGASGTTWRFAQPRSGSPAITRAIVRRRSASPDFLKILLKGTVECIDVPAAPLPLSASVVLTPPQALDERCGDAHFPGSPGPTCELRRGGRKIACR